VLTATQLPGFGRDHFRHMQKFAHLAGLLVLLHDRSAGTVAPGASPARPKISYTLLPDDARLLAEGLVHSAQILFAGGAREVLIPYAIDPLLLGPKDDLAAITRRGVAQHGRNAIPLASTHPQSTCRMSGKPADGVVDAFGECHEVTGLFVADMSVFPTSLGAPPQITTAALADRTARHLLGRFGELRG
jgi:choline dehydrogenase-like flavoprotein